MTTYLLDANVFIQAKNQYYGFDIVPAFWAWLIAANGAGTSSVSKRSQMSSSDTATSSLSGRRLETRSAGSSYQLTRPFSKA